MARKRLELELDPGGGTNTKWLLLDHTCISFMLPRVNPSFLKFHFIGDICPRQHKLCGCQSTPEG